MDRSDHGCEVSPGLDSGDDTRELLESIGHFPTSNQPVLDTTLKYILVSLWSSLHADMLSCVHTFGIEIQAVISRVDHSRRNNLKIRSVPKSVHKSDLHMYPAQLFTYIVPDLTELDITVDRIHHLPRPLYPPDNVHRDIILCLHFFHMKQRLMSASRNKDLFPPQYKDPGGLAYAWR